MEFGSRSINKGKAKCQGKGKFPQTDVQCFCALPAKKCKSWTDKNPARRFYGCERWKTPLDCGFFKWIDVEEPFGWQKQALIEARDEIAQKERTIMELKKTIACLQSDFGKTKGMEEDIINGFLKLCRDV